MTNAFKHESRSQPHSIQFYQATRLQEIMKESLCIEIIKSQTLIGQSKDKPVGMLATFYKCSFLKNNMIQTNRTNPIMMGTIVIKMTVSNTTATLTSH